MNTDTQIITENIVRDIIQSRGIAFPHPRLGTISINGGRQQKATKAAIKLAQAKGNPK